MDIKINKAIKPQREREKEERDNSSHCKWTAVVVKTLRIWTIKLCGVQKPFGAREFVGSTFRKYFRHEVWGKTRGKSRPETQDLRLLFLASVSVVACFKYRCAGLRVSWGARKRGL